MLCAYASKVLLILLAAEIAHRVSAEKGERALAAKLSPELLQLHGSLALATGPENGHHFPECSYWSERCARAAHTIEQGADGLVESARIRATIAHESRDRLFRVHCKASVQHYMAWNTGVIQLLQYQTTMRLGSD